MVCAAEQTNHLDSFFLSLSLHILILLGFFLSLSLLCSALPFFTRLSLNRARWDAHRSATGRVHQSCSFSLSLSLVSFSTTEKSTEREREKRREEKRRDRDREEERGKVALRSNRPAGALQAKH